MNRDAYVKGKKIRKPLPDEIEVGDVVELNMAALKGSYLVAGIVKYSDGAEFLLVNGREVTRDEYTIVRKWNE